ncbi:MAG: hypothetical protein RL681_781 [Candidatus Parcubacteria bacterium]
MNSRITTFPNLVRKLFPKRAICSGDMNMQHILSTFLNYCLSTISIL